MGDTQSEVQGILRDVRDLKSKMMTAGITTRFK